MKTDDNLMRAQLRSGELALGLGIGVLPSAAVPLVAASAGYSWLFIDLEHSPLTMKDAAELSMAALGSGLAAIVRLGREAIHDAGRALDNGASGIIMPRVHSGADAERLVKLCKYAPVGERSWGGPSPHLGFPARPGVELMERANRATMAIALIESIEGVANVEAIVATPGLDAIFIGAIDLSIEMGRSGDVTSPDVIASVSRCVSAARGGDIHVGLGGVFGAEALAQYRTLAFDFVLAGIDYRLLHDAIRQRAAALTLDWQRA